MFNNPKTFQLSSSVRVAIIHLCLDDHSKNRLKDGGWMWCRMTLGIGVILIEFGKGMMLNAMDFEPCTGYQLVFK